MDDEKGYYIKPDGSLWHGLRMLAQKDWHEVHNPKRSYYPEMDRTHPAYRKEFIMTDENPNILQIEKL